MTELPATGLLANAIFVLAGATTAAGAIIAVGTHRIIRSVCGLALCCIGLAGLYYFLRSPFLALMEILIYVGAVCVTIVFAVMLAEPDEPESRKLTAIDWVWTDGLLLASGLIFWGLLRLGLHSPATAAGTTAVERVTDGSVAAIGLALLTRYSMAFELISLVLMVAILGALAIARPGRDRP